MRGVMKPDSTLKNRPCVYGIFNLMDGKVYIGRTKCIYKRCHQYSYDFRERRIGHLNDYLYRAMVKHGFENFEMRPLEFADERLLPEKETLWMFKTSSFMREFGYNLRMDSSGGMFASDETRKKISGNLTRQWGNGERTEHAKKLSAAWVGRDDWKKAAAENLRRTLTKWVYTVILNDGTIRENCDHRDLQQLKLEACLGSFHRKQSDLVRVKGCWIRRRRIAP